MRYLIPSMTLYLVIALAMLSATVWVVVAFFRHSELDGLSRTRLKDVLGLPWKATFPITRSEHSIIRDLQLGEPVFISEHRIWPTPPLRGPLAVSGAARRRLERGIGHLRALGGQDVLNLQQLQQEARNELIAATRLATGSWLPKYHLGLYYLFSNQYASAVQELQRARKVLQPLIDTPSRFLEIRLQTYEARIVTLYALAEAYRHQPGREVFAWNHYLMAIEACYSFSYEPVVSGAYEGIADPAQLFKLVETGTATASVWNDLLAAGLTLKGFQSCPDVDPVYPDCSEVSSFTCPDRDRLFCQVIGGPNSSQETDFIYLDFYNGETPREESFLWVIAYALELERANSNLTHHLGLLYNSALAHIQADHYHRAEALLERSREVEIVSENMSDALFKLSTRAEKLRLIVRLLTGGEIAASSCPAGESASHGGLRELFVNMYMEDHNPSFPPMGSCFPQADPSRSVDRWLFIHRWRNLLEAGKFQVFEREYRSFLQQPEVFPDFFEAWRRDVFELIGLRALEQMAAHKGRGEPDKAKVIRQFLYLSGYFPDEVTDKLGLTLIEKLHPMQRYWMPFLAWFMALVAFSFWHARHTALRRIFISFHRTSRLKHAH